MRQLMPTTLEGVDPDLLYAADARPAPGGRPWVVVNMIVTADGATAVAGRSGGLGTPADRAVFTALRSVADAILVGAGTVRAEGYGPPRTPPQQQERRLARGQSRFPRIAIVSGRLALDVSSPLFTESVEPPIVLAPASAPRDARTAVAQVAELHTVGEDEVDLGAGLAVLADGGARVVLCEGGPHLNGQLLAAGLIDELCLSVSPLLAGGDSARAINGPDPATPTGLRLDRVLEDDGMLLLRYVRS